MAGLGRKAAAERGVAEKLMARSKRHELSTEHSRSGNEIK